MHHKVVLKPTKAAHPQTPEEKKGEKTRDNSSDKRHACRIIPTYLLIILMY